MKYLKEIVKAIRDRKKLPALAALMAQHAAWKAYQVNVDVFQAKTPWITFSAIDFLQKYLKRDMHVLEFGGGGSSLFFASRVKELVTIEHNQEWFKGLEREMKASQAAGLQWTGRFIEPDPVPSTKNLSISNPDDYYSDDKNFRDKIFKTYATAIDAYPDNYFDLVLVDGRARPSCLQHSLAKVKIDAILILDNSDRPYYLEQFKDKLKNFELVSETFGPTPYVPWFTQTNIWRRIK